MCVCVSKKVKDGCCVFCIWVCVLGFMRVFKIGVLCFHKSVCISKMCAVCLAFGCVCVLGLCEFSNWCCVFS